MPYRRNYTKIYDHPSFGIMGLSFSQNKSWCYRIDNIRIRSSNSITHYLTLLNRISLNDVVLLTLKITSVDGSTNVSSSCLKQISQLCTLAMTNIHQFTFLVQVPQN